MREKVYQKLGVNLNHLIYVVTPHLGNDIMKGLIMPTYEYDYNIGVNRPGKIWEGMVPRISYQNKVDLKR